MVGRLIEAGVQFFFVFCFVWFNALCPPDGRAAKPKSGAGGA